MRTVRMPEVLCPSCVNQGYLEVILFGGLPVMNCRLCDWFVLGHWDDGDAVFPDPHVSVPGGNGGGNP